MYKLVCATQQLKLNPREQEICMNRNADEIQVPLYEQNGTKYTVTSCPYVHITSVARAWGGTSAHVTVPLA